MIIYVYRIGLMIDDSTLINGAIKFYEKIGIMCVKIVTKYNIINIHKIKKFSGACIDFPACGHLPHKRTPLCSVVNTVIPSYYMSIRTF